MMDSNRLWAKSKRNDECEHPSMFLSQHLKDVYEAATKVLDATGDDQLLALGLNPDEYRARLRRCVLLAAAVHDLGKANDHFQGMICRAKEREGRQQGVRHEWISVLLLQQLKDWLLPAVNGDKIDFAIVQWAVGGHHPAYNRESPPRRRTPQGEGDQVVVSVHHPDFRDCLKVIAACLNLKDPPSFSSPWKLPLIGQELVFGKFEQWHRNAVITWEEFVAKDKRLVAAIKLSLIAADVAGSAISRLSNEAERTNWISTALANTPQSGDLAEIVDKRLEAERTVRKDPSINLRDFQKAIGASTAEVTFAKAGCGSGKTLAAYHWAAFNYPTRRLYLCYPTTGTATEGFRDYLYNPDFDFNPRLFHGRAEVDMAMILKGEEESPEADAAARIESLDAWSTPVVSCTIDTVLGLIQNNRRSRYAWPALAGASFVFDEIHAYDDKLFGALLRFLQNLPGMPVLLMTASLPLARFTALHDCLKRAKRSPMNIVPSAWQTFPDLDELEKFPRYYREQTATDITERIRHEIADRGKVLWVSNTVDRAVAAADSIGDLNPEIYHSRFRYCNRVDRHKTVVDAFKADNPKPVVACTTQVCEMSLDLAGVTLLVTELAPVPALIQHLGRLNRKAKPGDPPRPFIVTELGEKQSAPYESAELQSAREWLNDLPIDALSQRDLSNSWEKFDVGESPRGCESKWLDGGPQTEVGELRKESHGIMVLLEMPKYHDATSVRQGLKKLADVALPMPRPPAGWRGWEQIKGVPVPPPEEVFYDPQRGGKWVNA